MHREAIEDGRLQERGGVTAEEKGGRKGGLRWRD